MLHLYVFGYKVETEFGLFAHVEGPDAAAELAGKFIPPLSEGEWYTRVCEYATCDYSDLED